MWQSSVWVQVSVCNVSAPSIATRITANCTKLLSVIYGSGDCISNLLPYFIFCYVFILHFFLEKICVIVMGGSLKYIRGYNVFMDTNFFSTTLVFFYKKKR